MSHPGRLDIAGPSRRDVDMTLILNESLPIDPAGYKLPGTRPIGADEWAVTDEIYALQMAERDRLIRERRDDVFRILPQAEPAAREVLDHVLALVATWPGYIVSPSSVTRPDGVTVDMSGDHPLLIAGRLLQEDLCILEYDETAAEHVLTGAILCFPSYWVLAEKLGRPMMSIHVPVPHYDESVGRRVQRLLDSIRADAPLCRFNFLKTDEPQLFKPRSEADKKARPAIGKFLRSERQCLVRMPKSNAVLFTIHTYTVRNTEVGG